MWQLWPSYQIATRGHNARKEEKRGARVRTGAIPRYVQPISQLTRGSFWPRTEARCPFGGGGEKGPPGRGYPFGKGPWEGAPPKGEGRKGREAPKGGFFFCLLYFTFTFSFFTFIIFNFVFHDFLIISFFFFLLFYVFTFIFSLLYFA